MYALFLLKTFLKDAGFTDPGYVDKTPDIYVDYRDLTFIKTYENLTDLIKEYPNYYLNKYRVSFGGYSFLNKKWNSYIGPGKPPIEMLVIDIDSTASELDKFKPLIRDMRITLCMDIET